MASNAEILSRGQASRNRQWAGAQARFQRGAQIVLALALAGSWLGWATAPELTQRGAKLYVKAQWAEVKDPFARNLQTAQARARVGNRDAILDERSPASRSFWRLLWRMAGFAVVLGLAIGIPAYRAQKRRWAIEGERAGRDRTVRGTRVVSARELAGMVPTDAADGQPVTIGGVPVPRTEEARHFLFAGATGTGKTMAIFRMLDRVERRGEHAFVHDVDGSYVARYYRPERGDLILNPFDARCAYWNPFADVRSPADADRLAGFIVAKPGGGGAGDDVWYDQARIVVGAVIRRLWEGGRGTVPELTRALRDMTPDELSQLTAGTEAARVFQKDADKATASVLFCLAEAAKVVGALRTAPGAGGSLSFDDFYAGLADAEGAKPWLFLASRKRNFAAARPLLGCWLDCAVAAILDRPVKGAPRAWLVLDELPALPRASGLLTLLPEGRKFGAAVVIAFQAIGQLRETYGPNAASTIVGQAGTQLVMRLGDPDSTGWAARLLGKAEVEEHRASQSLDTDEMHDKGSLSTMRQTRDVVLDSQIGELAPLTGYLRLSGLPVAKVKIGRKHMDRADVAEGTVALPTASPPPPPQSSPLAAPPRAQPLSRPPEPPTPGPAPTQPPPRKPPEDRTLGGAL